MVLLTLVPSTEMADPVFGTALYLCRSLAILLTLYPKVKLSMICFKGNNLTYFS